MSFFDKMKNLFTDEVDEEPIKSEVIQVEIPSPARSEENISDNENIKDEEKVSTPIFFDDDYFKELDQPKKENKVITRETVKPREERKQFKPTPIISPIYGVLDKNYNKEDITTKQDVKTTNVDSLDEVRKKAFGTLEDELEDTLFGSKSILFNDVQETNDEPKEEDLFDELIEIDDENIINEKLEQETEKKVSESELLDLIDSIYEKGE